MHIYIYIYIYITPNLKGMWTESLLARVMVKLVIFKLTINFSNSIKGLAIFIFLLFKTYFMFLNQKE